MVQGSEDDIDSLRPLGEAVTCDLADLEKLKQLCIGVHTIVHMAGDADASATWADLLAANIVGTYHVFAAAKFAGVKRVIYASSIHAVSGYPADYQVHTTDPVNPGDLYGVSKCFGEAMARYAAGQEGVRRDLPADRRVSTAGKNANRSGPENARRLGVAPRPGAVDSPVHRRRGNPVRDLSRPQRQPLQAARHHRCPRKRWGYAPQDDLTEAPVAGAAAIERNDSRSTT